MKKRISHIDMDNVSNVESKRIKLSLGKLSVDINGYPNWVVVIILLIFLATFTLILNPGLIAILLISFPLDTFG